MEEKEKDPSKPENSDEGKDQKGRGRCQCQPWEPKKYEGQSVRRLIKALEGELESIDPPTDATKKFADDLKECDKEYQGLDDILKKYKETYDKLDCQLTEADKHKEEISEWCRGKVGDDVKKKIETLWLTHYEKKERTTCCPWLVFRKEVNDLLDCRKQSDKEADERKEDFDTLKDFEKSLKDRFTELKSLYDKAKALRDAEHYKSVCAIELEYSKVRKNLGVVQTWQQRYKDCRSEQKDYAEIPNVEKFRDMLTQALSVLILAKYQRFRWYQDWIEKDNKGKKAKEACEKFRKNRREEFIQEAEEVTTQNAAEGPAQKPTQQTAQEVAQQPGQRPPAAQYVDK